MLSQSRLSKRRWCAGDDADTLASVDGGPTEAPLQSAEEAKAEPAAAGEASESAEGAESDEALPSSLAKAERAKAAREETGDDTMTTAAGKEIKMSSQKEITVADDFETSVRCQTLPIPPFLGSVCPCQHVPCIDPRTVTREMDARLSSTLRNSRGH